MKIFLAIAIAIIGSVHLAQANFSGGFKSEQRACPKGQHLVCAPHLAGGCNNMICVRDQPKHEPQELCEDIRFQVVGTQKDGKICQPGYFYPECARTSEQDAQVSARKECYPLKSKRVSPWKFVNSTQVESEFTCCQESSDNNF